MAAEEARDEFVDLLSPKKAPRPAGSPAPKATETQLRAALKVSFGLSHVLAAVCVCLYLNLYIPAQHRPTAHLDKSLIWILALKCLLTGVFIAPKCQTIGAHLHVLLRCLSDTQIPVVMLGMS